MPQEEILEEGRPYNCGPGKGLKGGRMAEWPIVVMKESNVSGAKGPC
jgi:hypothetical protein